MANVKSSAHFLCPAPNVSLRNLRTWPLIGNIAKLSILENIWEFIILTPLVFLIVDSLEACRYERVKTEITEVVVIWSEHFDGSGLGKVNVILEINKENIMAFSNQHIHCSAFCIPSTFR
jgi:hypothetical protein